MLSLLRQPHHKTEYTILYLLTSISNRKFSKNFLPIFDPEEVNFKQLKNIFLNVKVSIKVCKTWSFKSFVTQTSVLKNWFKNLPSCEHNDSMLF